MLATSITWGNSPVTTHKGSVADIRGTSLRSTAAPSRFCRSGRRPVSVVVEGNALIAGTERQRRRARGAHHRRVLRQAQVTQDALNHRGIPE